MPVIDRRRCNMLLAVSAGFILSACDQGPTENAAPVEVKGADLKKSVGATDSNFLMTPAAKAAKAGAAKK